MAFYKQTENGYLIAVGADMGGQAITEEEYNTILSVIRAKPSATETTDYRLREDLTWEAVPVDPPDPDPEIDEAEAYAIIFGGAT